MFCDHCGAKLSPGAQTCPSCGKSFVAFMPPKRGIAGHVRLLGIFWIAHGVLHVFPGMFLMAIFGSRFFPPDVPVFVSRLLPFIGGMLVASGVAAVLTGIGLLTRQSWARIAALILAAISLINIPFGTALGIYTMWALLPADHEEEYRALTRVA
jgi:hypothetical protein